MATPKYRILCLGGGAPNLTLMSGALHALHKAGLCEEKNRPNIITMAGAGAVVGLHYLAPKGLRSNDPFSLEALKNTMNFGISDAIYEMLPINYKVFTKSGPSADVFNEFWFSLPEVQQAMHQSGMSDDEALLGDALLFEGAMMCPTDVNFFSQGVCGYAQFLEDLIDFKALPNPNEIEIEINAFCIEKHELVEFTNYERDQNGEPLKTKDDKLIPKEITAEHLRAALAFPFLHAPYKIGDQHYYEGAAMQSLNDFKVKDVNDIEWIIVLDPLRKNMIGMPQNLWDAFALSILMPTAGLGELGRIILKFRTKLPHTLALTQAFTQHFAGLPEEHLLSPVETMLMVGLTGPKKKRLYLSEFKIPEEKVPRAWGWSRSSLRDLFEIGGAAGREIAEEMRDDGHL